MRPMTPAMQAWSPLIPTPVACLSRKPLSTEKGNPLDFRVFRNPNPLKDPTTQQVLGYEAQYVGRAELVRGESIVQIAGKDGQAQGEITSSRVALSDHGGSRPDCGQSDGGRRHPGCTLGSAQHDQAHAPGPITTSETVPAAAARATSAALDCSTSSETSRPPVVGSLVSLST